MNNYRKLKYFKIIPIFITYLLVNEYRQKSDNY